MTRSVLVVEDNQEIAELVRLHLLDIDCSAVIESDGRHALDRIRGSKFDLVILDLMLPGLDGMTVCREIRALPGYLPILILSARSSELDRVVGLEMGADDYLTKPFGVPELQARVKALLRRAHAMSGGSEPRADDVILTRGRMAIDVARRVVTIDGQVVTLTAKEFDLLLHFARHPGRVYDRSQLLDEVWGYEHSGYEHTVNSHINRLRGKIEDDPARPQCILTVWGVGYKFADPE